MCARRRESCANGWEKILECELATGARIKLYLTCGNEAAEACKEKIGKVLSVGYQ